ncbi:13791_t:CDS:2, partial [Dentiscutata heterogama]
YNFIIGVITIEAIEVFVVVRVGCDFKLLLFKLLEFLLLLGCDFIIEVIAIGVIEVFIVIKLLLELVFVI